MMSAALYPNYFSKAADARVHRICECCEKRTHINELYMIEDLEICKTCKINELYKAISKVA